MALGKACTTALSFTSGFKETTFNCSGFSSEGTLLNVFAVLHCRVHREKVLEGGGDERKWTGKGEISQVEFLAADVSSKVMLWPTPTLKERTFDSPGLSAEGTLIFPSAVPHCGDEKNREKMGNFQISKKDKAIFILKNQMDALEQYSRRIPIRRGPFPKSIHKNADVIVKAVANGLCADPSDERRPQLPGRKKVRNRVLGQAQPGEVDFAQQASRGEGALGGWRVRRGGMERR